MVAEVRRVFQYHGAEHKTIFAYEAGKPLTLENVRAQSRAASALRHHVLGGGDRRLHRARVRWSSPLLLGNAHGFSGWVLTFLLRVALLPLVAAISYELQRLSARYCTTGPLRVLLYPGFLFQKITTREPDDAQLEIAIAAMEVARVRDDAPDPVDVSKPDQLHVFPSFASVATSDRRHDRCRARPSKVHASDSEARIADGCATREIEELLVSAVTSCPTPVSTPRSTASAPS